MAGTFKFGNNSKLVVMALSSMIWSAICCCCCLTSVDGIELLILLKLSTISSFRGDVHGQQKPVL